MPSGIASTVATSVAISATWSDSANRSVISSVIGRPGPHGAAEVEPEEPVR